MDSHETLKVARTIKERGNDCFKRGQLPEAQRDYTEVLAMLTEEITFTGDDQRKEKETLVLTVHLNLAQCALRLGDNARVIYHCNTALGMESNNVKAHFRKARAFENRAEFAEALEGYRHVLTLEPDNETVQRQLSKCQKKLDSQKAIEQMSNKMAGQEDQETEDEDVEVVYKDSERDPQARYKNCTKNPGHKKFININDFKIEHLPPDYRDQELFDHIKYQSQMTVMLKIWPARKFRSGCGPGNDRNNSGNPGPDRRVRPLRHGSGWVDQIQLHTEDEQPCPYQRWTKLGSPVKRWAKIFIMAAAHVVRNGKEANNTECYFCYDTEEEDVNFCQKLSGAVILIRCEKSDTCTLTFISHDDNFSQHLYEMKLIQIQPLYSIRLKYLSPALNVPERNLDELWDQLIQRSTELRTEEGRLVEQIVAIVNGDPYAELVKHRKGRKDKLKDDMLSVVLLDKICGRVRYQQWIEGLVYNAFCYELSKNILKYRQLTHPSKNDYLSALRHFKYLKKWVMRLKNWLDEDAPLEPLEEFNEDHRLTIIVSHPHGFSKKITIGETTERTAEYSGQYSQFTYTTSTCPGSSGAMVFILGLDTFFDSHPHSAGKSGRSFDQLNQSAMAPCW